MKSTSKPTWDHNFIFLMLFDENFRKQNRHLVPRKTFEYWKTHQLKHLQGRDYAPFDPEAISDLYQIYSNKRIFALAKASAHANARFLEVFEKLDSKLKKSIFSEFKEDITGTFNLISNFVSKDKAYKLLGVNPHFIHYKSDEKICHTSAFGKCLKKHPLQMLSTEIEKIKDFFFSSPYKYWQKSSVYWKLRCENIIHCSLSTFYRVTKKLGITSQRAMKPSEKSESLKAEKTLKIIHMDVSRIPINNRYLYLYSIVDNYSSKVLSHAVHDKVNSEYALQVLLNACRKYQLHFDPQTLLITDGGSEFKKYVNRFLDLPYVNIVKKIAYTDIYASNNKIEAFFSQIKSHHLRLEGNEVLKEARAKIDNAIEEYSNKYINSL